MTQIVGDARHLRGKPLNGSIASGQVWEFDGSAFVPVVGPTAVGIIASEASNVAAAVSGDFGDFHDDEYPSFLAEEFYPLSGKVDATSGMASYASGAVDDVSGQSGFVIASGAGLMVFRGSPASGKVPKLSGTNILTDLYWANDETSMISGATSDVVGGRLDLATAVQIKWRFSRSNQVRLFNPTLGQWEIVTCSAEPTFPSTGTDLDGSGLVAGANYDVYGEYSGANGFNLVLKRWTSDTSRAVTPALWQGVLCYDNTTDVGKKRRYLGLVRLYDDSGAPRFADAGNRRFVANLYDQARSHMLLQDSTSHDYDTGAWRPWNDDASLTRIEWVALDPLVISTDMRFYFSAGAVGDRAQLRMNYNGNVGHTIVLTAGAAGTATIAGLTMISQRVGYNSSYIEEFGYTDDLIYSQIGAIFEIWR